MNLEANEITEQHAKEFRSLFINHIKSQTVSGKIGLAMSGGIDSMSIFFSLIDLKIDFECYTFYQKGYESEFLT